MKKRTIILFAVISISGLLVGCSKPTTNRPEDSTAINTKEHEHGHKSVHGGSMNAIITCENGHAEVKLENGKLCLWFVGGGSDTAKSVRIPDPSVKLDVKTANTTKTLSLAAKPLELAGEKVGDCSYFESQVSGLNSTDEFTANGQVTFKGKKVPLIIEYPRGYDPD